MSTTFFVACLVGLAVCLAGEQLQQRPLRAIGKVVASLSFVAYAVALGVPDVPGHGLPIVIGLVLSVVGDVALLWDDKRVFLFGLVAFLLAHVAYAGAFVVLGPSTLGMMGAAVVLLPAAAGIWRWMAPHVGRLKVPVIAYVFVITAMATLAIGVAAAEPTTGRLGLAGAAILFFLSDIFVARQRFVAQDLLNRWIGLPLYFGAQLLFGAAAAIA